MPIKNIHGETLPIKNTWDKLPIQNIWGQIAANTKYMGTDCQYKYGDRLPIKNIWGQIANKKYMGTDCDK